MRRRGVAPAVILCAGLLGAGAAAGQDLKRPEEQLAAIYALKVQLEVEQQRLDDTLQKYLKTSAAREDVRSRVRHLYDELDGMISGKIEASPDDIEARETDIARAEQELETLTRRGRELRDGLRDSHERISLLDDRLGRLRKSLPSDTESLTGTWSVTYLPSGDKGTFTLRQSGTLLVGEYALEGGWRGSLQGTVVNGKVLLHRIDSKLGSSQSLEGTLAPDGRTLRGRWQNFILSGGEPTTGDWLAEKKERTES